MWFYPLLLIFVVLGLVGIIFLGGVYTLVLVPLAVIGLVSVVGYTMWIRAQAAGAGGETAASDADETPLPHRRERPPSHVATTPDRLVDARRETARSPER